MKCRRLPFSVYLSLFLFFVTNICATDVYPAMRCAEELPQFNIQRYPEEGFGAGTLVRVTDGYKPIETITDQDMVYGEHLGLKRVLKIAKRFVQRYICLKINNDIIHAGVEQSVRTAYDPLWQQVGTLQEDTCLLDILVTFRNIDKYELISKPIVLYQLEVEDHIFCVGPSNIIVHNADVATVSAAMLCLEYVAYAYPVVTLVGCTIALSTIACQAYKAWQQSRQSTDMDDDTLETVPQEVFLAERYYYEQRKKELTTLRDEFAGIYRGIVAMKELFHPQINTFSSQFLQHTVSQHTPSNLLRISITDELKLSDDRKAILRNAREQELALLEKEINELHALLVVHCNEIINQVYDAYDVCIKYTTEVQNGIALWNNNKHTLTDQIASQSYEKEIMQECLLHNVQQKTAELKVIIAYYTQHKQLSSLQQSTNIVELLDFGEQLIKEIEQWVQGQLKHVYAIMSVSEQYFAQRAIPTALFKNQVKNTFNREQNNRNIQALKNAQNKLSNMNNNNGGPNEPKKPRNDDDFENMYEVFKKAAIGKILKDAVEGTHFAYRNVSKIYRVIKDVAEYGIKKGDWLYLDTMHGDIEVFKKCGTVIRTVLNMDGTQNVAKTVAAAGRDILKWIR